MNESIARPTRRQLLHGAAALGAALGGPDRAAAQTGRKRFDGTTLNVACWSAPYPKWLGEYLSEFEAETGMKVVLETPGFPVYNQRADLELSTRGSAFDVLNITFIYASRWIGAGWFTPLDDFINDRQKTPADWDAGDFLEGALQPMKDRDGKLYALPWTTDVLVASAARFDLVRQAGLGMPETFDDIDTVLKSVHRKEDVAAFVNENLHGWSWIPYLQGFGGNVFRAPPDDLMPTLDTPEAVAAAEWYANLLETYAPDGVLSYTYDQALASLKQGRSNYTTMNLPYVMQLGDEKTSRVSRTVGYSLMPAGPKGRFPGISVHGWGIPVASKNKDAAWEFIKWALSKAMLQRMLVEKGYASITRRSVIATPAFRDSTTVNGIDIGDLYLKTVDLAKQGHMAYRTVHVYPQVNQQINKAIGAVASGQVSAKEALRQAQAGALADLRRAGVKL